MPVSDLAAVDVTGVPYDQWQLYAGASKPAAVAANDGDTTMIRSGTSNYRQCFNVAWPSPSVLGKVNSLTAKGYLKYVTYSGWYAGVGCRNASGERMSKVAMTTAYALYTQACPRPGGGSWTPADCASGVTWLQVMCYTSPGGGNVPCTQAWFTLDYDAGGTFVSLIWHDNFSILLPLLGLLGALSGISRSGSELLLAAVNPEAYRHSRTRFRRDELPMVLEALRQIQSRPRFVFLGQPAML